MTTRTDVVVDFLQSPRVAEIAEPSTAINMQDTVDTLRKQEDGFSTGLAFNKLLNASGKEDLGGGVLVGITVALQNLLVSFEARRTPAESGTVTTGSGTPILGVLGPTYDFVDTAADFIAANVQPGSMVINFTDRSIADVVRVDDTDTLVTKVLVNGVTNTYQIGDIYQVFNIIQCDLDGGNLVAVDDLAATISPVLPTAFTQIVRTSASSATLQEQEDIQFASFLGRVTIDVVNGVSGTAFPIGTARTPVDNLADAKTILLARGFSTFFIIGDFTISNETIPYKFIGQGPERSIFTVLSSADVTNSLFEQCEISGDLSGVSIVRDCHIRTVTNFSGDMHDCLLESGTITLGGGGTVALIDCWDGTAGLTQPVIDFGGSGQELVIRNYPGGLEIRNKTGNEEVSITGNGIRIFINDTVTNGNIILRGTGKFDNEDIYVGGATIVNELISSKEIVATLDANLYDGKPFSDVIEDLISMSTGRIVEDPPDSGIFKFYAQDNTTVLYTLTKAPGSNERIRS